MRVRTGLAAITVLAGLMVAPGAAAGAGWDLTPLALSPATQNSPALSPVAETTDDGATWVMWTEDPDNSGLSDVVVRRIDPNGVAGQVRTLSTSSPQYNGSFALAPLPGGAVRVAYVSASGGTLEERRLTPTATGDPVVLYDKADVVDGGNVSGSTARVLSAPSGASWVVFVRLNSGGTTPVVTAYRIADDDSVSSAAALTQIAYEYGAAVDPTGRLIVAVASGGQGRMVLVPIATDAGVGSEVEIRPVFGSFAAANTPAIGIDAAGIATVGWRLDNDRYLEARRVDTSTMTPQGTGATRMDDDLPADFVQYGPLFGVDPGGGVVMGWYETDSFNEHNDAMVRVLADGAFGDTGVIGPRLQLDGPPPEGGAPSALIPGPDGIVTAFFYTNSPSCSAARIDMATGDVLQTDAIAASGCAAPNGPASAANGLVATWTQSGTYRIELSRYVADPPACSDGAPVTVAAGASVSLSLPCTGWRPTRQITGPPAHGTLGTVDDTAGTVTYTAGAEGGADLVRFRGANGAGTSDEHSVAITVTAPPPGQPPGGSGPPPPPPPPDSSDRTPPVLSGVSLKPKRVRRGKARMPVLGLSLSESAKVRVTVQRCRNRRCTKRTTRKRVTADVAAGRAKLKLDVRRLPAGRYRVSVTATDTAGNVSKAVRVSLTIARR